MLQPVAVGFDGSKDSQAAVDFAVMEARLRRLPLLLLHAVEIPVMTSPPDAMLYLPHDSPFREAVGKMMSELKERTEQQAPDLDVSTELLDSVTVAGTLVDKSGEFALLVSGGRGRGGFRGLMLGSTSAQLVSHSKCPVIVARARASEGPHRGSVVVGVDGVENSQPALRFAFEEASLRGIGLTAVHAWHYPTSSRPGDPGAVVYDRDSTAEQEAHLAEALAPCGDKFPNVEVDQRPVRGSAREVLLDEAKGAELLVVGSRGRGGFAGMLLGSTSQAMLRHAEAPVAVVHDVHRPDSPQ